MVRMHFWDNQKLGKCSIYISHLCNKFTMRVEHFQSGRYLRTQYAILRMPPFLKCTSMNRVFFILFFHKMNASYVWNPCLWQKEPWIFFAIGNIIYINGILMLEWGDIFRTGDVWERSMPFRSCPHSNDVPLSIVQLLFYYHMQVLPVWMCSSDNREL